MSRKQYIDDHGGFAIAEFLRQPDLESTKHVVRAVAVKAEVGHPLPGYPPEGSRKGLGVADSFAEREGAAEEQNRRSATFSATARRAKAMRGQALKRELVPEDVARLVLFLASDDSAMITGQNFIIDGGWV